MAVMVSCTLTVVEQHTGVMLIRAATDEFVHPKGGQLDPNLVEEVVGRIGEDVTERAKTQCPDVFTRT